MVHTEGEKLQASEDGSWMSVVSFMGFCFAAGNGDASILRKCRKNIDVICSVGQGVPAQNATPHSSVLLFTAEGCALE